MTRMWRRLYGVCHRHRCLFGLLPWWVIYRMVGALRKT